jgi:hypothetical protein
MGCASRSDPDHIEWRGVGGVLPWLLAEKQNSDTTNSELSLTTLFPQPNRVGLASLTFASPHLSRNRPQCPQSSECERILLARHAAI